MRTNIELNDDLVAEARKYSRAKTKRALDVRRDDDPN